MHLQRERKEGGRGEGRREEVRGRGGGKEEGR